MVALATPRNANPSSVFLFQYFGSANQPPAGDHTLVVSKPPAGMPMMADDVTRRRTLNRERARDVCDRWGGRGRTVRRATVIREERRARRTPIARVAAVRSSRGSRATERRSGVTASHTAGFLALEPRGTDERAGAAAIEARDGRETGPCGGDAPRDETTSVGRRARVLHAARSDETWSSGGRHTGRDDDGEGEARRQTGWAWAREVAKTSFSAAVKKIPLLMTRGESITPPPRTPS